MNGTGDRGLWTLVKRMGVTKTWPKAARTTETDGV